MQYLLLIHSNEAGFASMPKEKVDQYLGAYTGYTEALKKAGDPGQRQSLAAHRGRDDRPDRSWKDAGP